MWTRKGLHNKVMQSHRVSCDSRLFPTAALSIIPHTASLVGWFSLWSCESGPSEKFSLSFFLSHCPWTETHLGVSSTSKERKWKRLYFLQGLAFLLEAKRQRNLCLQKPIYFLWCWVSEKRAWTKYAAQAKHVTYIILSNLSWRVTFVRRI